MVKKPFIFLLLILILLNQVYVDATLDYAPRNIDTECSPKNILVGSYVGGRSHLKPILDVAAILIERGHNVSNKNFTYYTFFLIIHKFIFISSFCSWYVGNTVDIRILCAIIRISNC